MRSEDILEYVRKRPFQPLRVTQTDGQTYEVFRPEMIMVGRNSVLLGIPRPKDTKLVFNRLITVSLLHIMQIEPLEATPTSSVD